MRKIRKHEIVLGIAVASIFWALILAWQSGVFQSSVVPSYYQEICTQDKDTGQKDCAPYNMAAYLLIRAFAALNDYNQLITALAAFASAVFAGTIFIVNRSQLKHSRDVERAYVSGGGTRHRNQRQEIRDGALHVIFEPTNVFDLRINNFGKTPATLHHAAIGFFDAAVVPENPPYEPQFPQVDVIGPGIGSQFLAYITIEGQFARTAICGRFYWHDIWGQEWSSGFVYEIPAPNAEFNGAISIETPATYRDEHREERDT